MAERNKRVLDNEVAIGTALLYRMDRLTAVDCGFVKDPNVRVLACLAGLAGSPLGILGNVMVASVHLDAQSEEKRVERLRTCLSRARGLGVRNIIIAGDMNTECLPGSCVAAMLASSPQPDEAQLARECASALRLGGDEGEPAAPGNAEQALPTEAQLEEYRALWKKAKAMPAEHRVSLSQVPTGPTRAGFDHGKTCGPCVAWRLDHIFYTERSLKLRAAWAALEGDPESLASGLPNRACPSDHLPVAAVFRPNPAPCLDEAGRKQLVQRLDELEARQNQDSIELKARLDAVEVPQVKKKGEKPSPEAIAQIQERRRLLKEQKERHAEERRHFVAETTELEQDVIDSLFDAGIWAETGERKRGPME